MCIHACICTYICVFIWMYVCECAFIHVYYNILYLLIVSVLWILIYSYILRQEDPPGCVDRIVSFVKEVNLFNKI